MWQGLIAIIAMVLIRLTAIIPGPEVAEVMVIPPMPSFSPAEYAEEIEILEWDEYWCESFMEHADEFTALFNSYETKRAKNGAMMIRKGNSGSYRFAKKG